jgi:chemotaxis protein CheD
MVSRPSSSHKSDIHDHHSELLLEVGIGEYSVAGHPGRLIAPALGSCVGVALWDPNTRRGGLAHVMLPTPVSMSVNPESGRFASWAVPSLIELMIDAGSPRNRLVAKIAGGAAMFGDDPTGQGLGDRNVAEVKYQLRLAHIPVLAEDVGGRHARTVELHLDSGLLVVRSYNFGTCEL